MQKVDNRIESIFSHAVAMDQAGRLRNTIYIQNKEVYILNSDRTVMLRFILPAAAAPFKNPVSFRASDYDSSTFYEENGKIIFVAKSGDMVRKKSCSTPDLDPSEAAELFAKFKPVKKNRFQIHKNIIPLLDENLSHIEFVGTDGQLMIIQRNIYDGTVINIEREKASGFGVTSNDDINSDFGPLGLRTNDFLALFAFNDQITFSFPDGIKSGFCRVMGRNFKMSGIVALCIYDELGSIETVEEEKPEPKKTKRTKPRPKKKK